MEKEKKKETETPAQNPVKVKFKNTYMGDKGNFYAGRVYEIPMETYEQLKKDCVKEA